VENRNIKMDFKDKDTREWNKPERDQKPALMNMTVGLWIL
jgi:hypothetical protein